MGSSSDNAVIDEIIKKRLLIDGDGMGDERKLNTLLKSYLAFVESDDKDEEDFMAFRRLVNQVKQMDFVARRTAEAIDMNERGQGDYDELGTLVQQEIVETKTQISDLKELLEEATKHRKHSMEYDALAKLIESKPDRKLTDFKKNQLEIDLSELRKTKETLDKRMDGRKRAMKMLSHSLELLNEQINGNELEPSRKISKGGHDLDFDFDSAPSSDPSSPRDQSMQEDTNISTVDGSFSSSASKMDVDPSNSLNESSEKNKSEKYDDLSESDTEDKPLE